MVSPWIRRVLARRLQEARLEGRVTIVGSCMDYIIENPGAAGPGEDGRLVFSEGFARHVVSLLQPGQAGFWLLPSEVAEFLKVPENTLEEWLKAYSPSP